MAVRLLVEVEEAIGLLFWVDGAVWFGFWFDCEVEGEGDSEES